MSEIDVELDGKKLWPDFKQYLDGSLTGIALATNESLASGDGHPSLKLRVNVDAGDNEEPVTVLVDVKIAHLIQIMAAVRGRLEHLQQIKDLIHSVKS